MQYKLLTNSFGDVGRTVFVTDDDDVLNIVDNDDDMADKGNADAIEEAVVVFTATFAADVLNCVENEGTNDATDEPAVVFVAVAASADDILNCGDNDVVVVSKFATDFKGDDKRQPAGETKHPMHQISTLPIKYVLTN